MRMVMKLFRFITLLLTWILLSACQPGTGGFKSQSRAHEVPITFEPYEDESINQPIVEPLNEPLNEPFTEPITDSPPQPELTSQSEKTDTPSNTSSKPGFFESIKNKVYSFIETTDMIMRYEGKKIGTACNHFLQRVLVAMGFPNKSFLANDFDNYAKQHFQKYRAVNFQSDATGSDRARLKQHLWSYPEGTAFILQWSRKNAHGHVAIVERINENLVIYQANLNRYTARKDQTTVDRLLSDRNRQVLTVYSEFE